MWWFRAEDPASVEIDALACCTECGVAVPEGSKPSAALKRWLAGQPSWLLVYDNAEDVEAVRGFLPDGGRHHLLITSRNPAWGGLARPVSLETWTPEQGADFLAARLPGAERGALLALAATLGGLPLALEQAASFMEETGMTVEAYRAEAERIDTAGLILDEGRAATGYERSVLATLSIAFGRLSAEAAQLLRLCAFFSAEPIPERFFREQANSLAEPLAAAARDTVTWEKTVGQLRRFGLANRIAIPALDRPPDSTDARTEQALTLHRLTQEVTRHRLCADPADDCLAVQTLLRLACPEDTRLPAHWPRYASLLPHVRHLERYRSAGWLDNRRQSWLLDRLGSYLRDGPTLYAESRRLLEQALELDRSELGVEHLDALRSMNNLTLTLKAQGDLAGARGLQEQVLDLIRHLLGAEHPGNLLSMSNLAETLRAQGDLAGARGLQEQVLHLSRGVLGAEHSDTLRYMNNLAATLQAQDDLAGARGLQEQVLDLRRRVLGAEHPDTLGSMNNLAETLRAQGDLAGARGLQEQVLDLNRRVLGAEHPDTLTSMNNLALTLRAQGDLAGARGLQEQVLDLSRRVLGAEHPGTLSSMNNLAGTLQAQGDLAGARGLQEQALDLRRRVLGAEHPDTLRSMNNLAETLRAQGDLAGARGLQEAGARPLPPRPGRGTPGHPRLHGQPRRDAPVPGRPGRRPWPTGTGARHQAPRPGRGTPGHQRVGLQPLAYPVGGRRAGASARCVHPLSRVASGARPGHAGRRSAPDPRVARGALWPR